MNQAMSRAVAVAAVISAIAAVLLMAARASNAISFFEPLQGTTRGVEYEPLFSIWRHVVGKPVYTDQNSIPFSASFYNWLSYAAYGEVTRAVQSLLSLSDAWLPTITRLTSLAASFVGAVAAYLSFSVLLRPDRPELKALLAATAVFVFFGPLIGFFAIAAGPDMWPLAFNAVALYLFIRYYGARPLGTVIVIAVLSCIAWAFKQNFIFIPATLGLFLLVRRDLKGAAVLTVITCSAGALTLMVMGPAYLKLLYFGGTPLEFSFELFSKNLVNFSVKFLPVLLPAIAIALVFAMSNDVRDIIRKEIREKPIMMVPLLGFVVSAVISIPTSGIIQSSENHYFSLSYNMAFATLTLVFLVLRMSNPPRIVPSAIVMGWLGNLAAVSAVFLGFQGVISVRPFHDTMVAAKVCLTDLKEPVFILNPYLALPWIISTQEPIVVHNAYLKDGGKVRKKAGKIGSLIEKGYFATVVIPKGANGRYDGTDLKLYRPRQPPCEGQVVYERTTKPGVKDGRQ